MLIDCWIIKLGCDLRNFMLQALEGAFVDVLTLKYKFACIE